MCIGSGFVVYGVCGSVYGVCECVWWDVRIFNDSQNKLNQPFKSGDNLEIVQCIERRDFYLKSIFDIKW